MILYIEKQAKDYLQTKKIIEKIKNASIIYINNYKNIFDKNISNLSVEKSIIIAKLNSDPIGLAPSGYGHTGNAYFFKTSLNCIFDCSYCYLKGAFKNQSMLYFVNYDDIKNSIRKTIENSPLPNPPSEGEGIDQPQKKDVATSIPRGKTEREHETIWFYSSDYSDILGMDSLSGFIQEFVPFFEQFDNTMMEIRTKSSNIKPLLELGFVPKNTEIAFSLNPQVLINKYEKGTSSLESRVKAINELLDKGFKVGLRFLPLLPVKNYENLYGEFIEFIRNNIDMTKINSTFASGLLYTKKDYNTMLKKYPNLDILYMLEESDDKFVREARIIREIFYKMFKKLDKKCLLCLEN